MNNHSSYCGLVDAKIRASDKDLPISFDTEFVFTTIVCLKSYKYPLILTINIENSK